jgi:SAM-dependent methyltransferase
VTAATQVTNIEALAPEDQVKYLEEKLRLLKAGPPTTPAPPPAAPLRLDFGCGKNKREGFVGVDIRPFPGVDLVLDIATSAWPWADNSVDEAHASHFIEHLSWPERVHFFNELGRVMKPGAKALLIWPHWCSARYYGDPTHQAPMSEFALAYLNAEWRKVNAPHDDYASNVEHTWHEYTCDFDHTTSYSLAPWLNGRNQEFVQFSIAAYKEAAQDVMATLIKR